MAENSKIEWTDHTFNPWRETLGIWGDAGTRVVASEAMWREPLKWGAAAKAEGIRRRVFCASLADVCEDRNDLIEPRIRLKRLIEATPNLDWLLLTKRPDQYLRLFYGPEWWPSNVWAGTSVEDQRAAEKRIPHLLRVPATVRFLSCEPLLGPIDLHQANAIFPNSCGCLEEPGRTPCPHCKGTGAVSAINWVIIGGESGPKARPCNIDWIRGIVSQCKAASVPCFVKQVGRRAYAEIVESLPEGICDAPNPSIYDFAGRDPKGGDPAEWPEDLRVREFPSVTI